MASLWVQDTSNEWSILPLEGKAFALGLPDAPSIKALPADKAHDIGYEALLYESKRNTDQWIVMIRDSRHLRINGEPLLTGLRVLRDRDELHASPDHRYFFTTEQLAEVQSFDESQTKPVACPRCKQHISGGDLVVKCPQCDAWHHQTETDEKSLLCWTYSDKCSLCDQDTVLPGHYRWNPEEL